MKKELLPIGTVVLLKGAVKRLMIVGYAQQEKTDNGTGKIWDYAAVVFPEGFVSSDQFFLFDHEQIDKKFYDGYVDEEQTNFIEKVNDEISKLKNQNINNGEEKNTVNDQMFKLDE